MINCIAQQNFKLRHDVFSNENGEPGILLAKATFKMHQKNVLVHALLRDPLREPVRRFLPKFCVLNLQNFENNALKWKQWTKILQQKLKSSTDFEKKIKN